MRFKQKRLAMTPAISTIPQPRYVILVGMAFDETDASALNEAARIAALRPHSELHVVHAVVEQGASTTTAELVSIDGRLQAAPLEMQRRIDSLQAATPQRVVGHVRVGSPVRAILQTAADLNADMVVVGTHQRRGLKKLVLGSVAAQVLQDAHCPVLVAIPRDHSAVERSEQIDPPCPACLQARSQANDASVWCEQHSHAYLKPHVYEPSSTAGRQSVMSPY
jgi:nucleotide-binding universal stress UspA family protein